MVEVSLWNLPFTHVSFIQCKCYPVICLLCFACCGLDLDSVFGVLTKEEKEELDREELLRGHTERELEAKNATNDATGKSDVDLAKSEMTSTANALSLTSQKLLENQEKLKVCARVFVAARLSTKLLDY